MNIFLMMPLFAWGVPYKHHLGACVAAKTAALPTATNTLHQLTTAERHTPSILSFSIVQTGTTSLHYLPLPYSRVEDGLPCSLYLSERLLCMKCLPTALQASGRGGRNQGYNNGRRHLIYGGGGRNTKHIGRRREGEEGRGNIWNDSCTSPPSSPQPHQEEDLAFSIFKWPRR